MASAAVLGLGILGAAVAKRLVAEGHRVIVWTRSEEKRRAFHGGGAEVVDHASAAFERAQVIVLLLSDFAAIRGVLMTDGVAEGMRDKAVIQMGTIGVDESRQLNALVSSGGGLYIEAPVQGSQGEASRGELQIMLGVGEGGGGEGRGRGAEEGSAEEAADERGRSVRSSSGVLSSNQISQVAALISATEPSAPDDKGVEIIPKKAPVLKPSVPGTEASTDGFEGLLAAAEASAKVLASLGKQRVLVGPVGSAAALKLGVNHLLAAETVAFATSLLFVTANSVPVKTFMDVLRGSALYAKQFDKKLKNMTTHSYGAANFHTQHVLKDVSLFKEGATSAGLNTAMLEGLVRVVEASIEGGYATDDYSAICEGVSGNLCNKNK